MLSGAATSVTEIAGRSDFLPCFATVACMAYVIRLRTCPRACKEQRTHVLQQLENDVPKQISTRPEEEKGVLTLSVL